MQETYDVVVVGGGAAGLSGALTLGRARRRVLLVDGGEPRNAPAGHVHGYLGREGTPPTELLAIGRAELEPYDVDIRTGTVRALERLSGAGDARFTVALADGSVVSARRLLVCTGLVDELPPIAGLRERWGRDVIHCPYCHGYEVRDQAIGVLATGPLAVHQALLFRQWSAEVTLLQHTGPAPGEQEREQLAARGIAVVEGEVERLEVSGDAMTGVRVRGGSVVPLQAVVVGALARARAELLEPLGVEITPMVVGGAVVATSVAADAAGLTSVPGLYVAGNVADMRAQVLTSAAAGLWVGAAINADLIAEETAAAVEAARATMAA